MNKLWKKYDKLTDECYTQFITVNKNRKCWTDAFETLVNAIEAEREVNPGFARNYSELEEVLDYKVNIDGWLEDYLDDLEINNEWNQEIIVCKKLLSLFKWEDEYPSDLRFRVASALGSVGKTDEAHKYCEDWCEEQKDDIMAATSFIYAKIRMKDYLGAEEILHKYISESTKCDDENDIIFTAALQLYKANGDKDAEKWIDKELERYDQELGEYFMGNDDKANWDDEDLPFN